MATRSDLPGPKGSLVLGSLPQMRKDILGFYQEVHDTYGSLTTFRLAHINIVFVTEPKLIEQVLVTDRDKLQKSWDYQEIARVLGRGLLTNEGEDWKRKRKLIQPSFRHDRIAGYAQTMTEKTTEHVEKWTDGQSIDVAEEMSKITLDVIARTVLNVDIQGEGAVISHALELFMRQFEGMITSAIPLPLWVPTPGNRRAFRELGKLDDLMYRIIRERREQEEVGDDLLGQLLEARFEDGGRLSDKELRDELLTMILAGHETTALALTFTFLLLNDHPEVLEKLHAELDEVLGERAPTIEDMPKLKYARMIIDESLRLYPPAWGLGREVKKGETVELGGYSLKGGTQIALAQWVTHRDPRFWDDADAFKPERWDDEEAMKARPKYAYFPFAGGPRSCVGMHFALMEAVLVLAEIARKVDLEVTQARPLDLMPAITLRPRHGLSANVKLRRPATKVRAA